MSTSLPAGQFAMPTTYHFIISVGESSSTFFPNAYTLPVYIISILDCTGAEHFSVTFMLGNATVSKGHHSPF